MEKEKRTELVNEIKERKGELYEKWDVEGEAKDFVLRLKVRGDEDKIAVSLSIRRAEAGYRSAFYMWEIRTERDAEMFWNQLQGVEDSLCSFDKVPY